MQNHFTANAHVTQYKRNSLELTKQNDDRKQQNTNNNLFNIQDVLFLMYSYTEKKLGFMHMNNFPLSFSSLQLQ